MCRMTIGKTNDYFSHKTMLFNAFQSIYETMQLTVYNITFTSLPILLYGLFERHIPDSDLMDNPHIYK